MLNNDLDSMTFTWLLALGTLDCPGGMLGSQGQYTSWHAGVDDGFDEIPYRVRDYND